MLTLRLLVIFCFVTVLPLVSAQQDNVLIYTDQVQVTSEISPYTKLQENSPIIGTLMVTHNDNLKVDATSFRIGGDSLKVKYVKEVPLSSTSKLSISIYQFELKGMKKGSYTLSPISVKVGAKEYQSAPIEIVIDN